MSPLLKKKLTSKTDKAMLTKYCLISGVLAAVMMFFVFAVHNNTLIGGNLTVLRMDLYHQYGPLFSELYDRVKGGYSLVYSWTSGLGSSFTGNLFNYCASPFALLMFFTGHKNMPEAIALMILFKAVFSASSFTYYINKTNGKNRVESIAFGLLYAFCSYMVAYSWNIMWLDGMAIFPLVVLGIERIIQRNKPGLYIFALTYTMITNYYIAYMVCILAVMYFLYFFFGRYKISDRIAPAKKTEDTVSVAPAEITGEVNADETVSAFEALSPEEPASAVEPVSETSDAVDCVDTVVKENIAVEEIGETTENSIIEIPAENKPEKKKKDKHKLMDSRFFRTGFAFAISSLLCFFIAAICLLPVVQCLSTSSATSGKMPEEAKYYFDIFDFLANHLPGLETTIRSSGDDVLPNVYCGMLTILLIPMYFLNAEIPGRKKVVAAVLLSAFYMGFVLNYFNFVWHGFHMPNDLPYRYSFAYSFLLLTLAYQALLHIQNHTKKTIVAIGMIALLFIIFVQKIGSKNVGDLTLYLSVIFTFLYCIFLGVLLSAKSRKNVCAIVLSIIVMGELLLADTGRFVMQQPKDAYVDDYDDYQVISAEAEAGDNELFYRTELSKLRTRMDPSWYGYNGVSVFSSMAYEHVAKLMEKIGLFGNNINSYTYYPQTPIFNSITALRYIYDTQKIINNDDAYTYITENDNFTAYKYNYYLPIAFGVSENVEFWDTSSKNPFENQNSFIRSATGLTADTLEDVDATDVSVSNLSTVSVETVNGGDTFYVDKLSKGSTATATVTIDVEEAGDYYVYVGSTKLSSLKVNADNYNYEYFASAIQPFTLNVGDQPAGAQITVEYTIDASHDNATVTFQAARLNKEVWKEAYNILSEEKINLTSFDETVLEGTVNITDDNTVLYTSIPYDESWIITVDGKELTYSYDSENNVMSGDVVRIGDALIGVRLSKGEHTVKFNYKQKGTKEGMIFTSIGIIAVALLIFFKMFVEKKNLLPGFRPRLLSEIPSWKD